MSIFLAAAPILTSVVVILGLRQSALRAGAAGLAVALLVVVLAPEYRLAAAVTGLAGKEGALMRPALALAAAGLIGLGAILWFWIG